MLPAQILKQHPEMVTGQARQARVEVEKIGQDLGAISLEIEGIQVREKSVAENLRRLQDFQKSFHDRVAEAGKKLSHLKSLLASKHS